MSASTHRPSAAGNSVSSRGRKRDRPSGVRSSPFADFGSYMAEKNRKLRQQFDADSASAGEGGIFRGVSIFVDGLTVPSGQELKDIMLKHGGRFENYFSRNTVTHIICSNLPDSKMRNMRSFSRGLPVVRPAWVVESVAANRLLNCVSYLLIDSMNETSRQLKLSTFFSQRSILRSNNKKNAEYVNNENKDQLSYEKMHKNSFTLDHGEVPSTDGQDDEDPSSSPYNNDNGVPLSNENVHRNSLSSDHGDIPTHSSQDDEDPISPCTTHNESESEELKDADTCVKNEVSCQDFLCPEPSDLLHTENEDDIRCLKLPKTETGNSSNLPHSTLTDPNFVENYFKHSRLHFIGTWRNRYRKRFANMVGAKGINLHASCHSEKKKPTIIHIDLDCFFVSVVIRDFPEFVDKPVAVSHSNNPKGTAEISSANYPARNYGIKAGMFVREAKARCPDLLIFPYNFTAYEEVADKFYEILHRHCNKVQALSCDEAFLDMTECLNDDPEKVAAMIRSEVVASTRCTASAGISENLLLARVATRLAKPNGQCFIPFEKADEYLNNLAVKSLPGIGYTVADKLKRTGVENCSQLRMIPKEDLRKDFGIKTGDMLWNFCRGIDHSKVETVQETRSVGAEVNWGVRFHDCTDADNFLMNLCKEVSSRLQECGVQGRTITLKVKRRREGAGEPAKFLGCGDCETMSRSVTMAGSTDNIQTLYRITKQIFTAFHLAPRDVRGVGLKLSKLKHTTIPRKGTEENALECWLKSVPSEKMTRRTSAKICPSTIQGFDARQLNANASRPYFGTYNAANLSGNNVSELPPICSLDMEVVKSLPAEIISEINGMYNGKLKSLLAANKPVVEGTDVAISPIMQSEKCCHPFAPIAGLNDSASQVLAQSDDNFLTPKSGVEKRRKHPMNDKTLTISNPTQNKESNAGVGGRSSEKLEEMTVHRLAQESSRGIMPSTNSEITELMPGSISQLDVSVLDKLPDDVRADIFKQLPQHRNNDHDSDLVDFRYGHTYAGDQHNIGGLNCLFKGNPPECVEKFLASTSPMQNIVADMLLKLSSGDLLSSTFRSKSAMIVALSPEPDTDEWVAALSSFSNILKQYIHLKVESDIEELYSSFILLKRFSQGSPFFLELQNYVLPILQASVNEHYGGTLHF